MNPSEKAMNVSEKRILKLAIILFIIGLTVRYLPWGLPSIETFEVGDAVIVANASPPAMASADTADVVDKVKITTGPDLTNGLADEKMREDRPFEHSRKPKKKVTLPLHINAASAEDLCALKGVGPKLAEKIIEHRNTAGPFKGPSDLKKVHGIGKKKLENIIQSIIFD